MEFSGKSKGYWCFGSNKWSCDKYTLDEAFKLNDTLKNCRRCIDCSHCSNSELLINCNYCTRCSWLVNENNQDKKRGHIGKGIGCEDCNYEYFHSSSKMCRDCFSYKNYESCKT